MSHHALLAILLLACLGFAPSALADEPGASEHATPEESMLLAYVDDQGRLHVVDSLDLVPAEYRNRVRPAKLGEASTISSQKPPKRKTRRAAQPAKTAPPKRVDTAGQEPAGKSRGKSRKTRAERKKQLAELQEQRKQVVDELVLLEEGWLPPEKGAEDGAERPEPTSEELDRHATALSKRLDQLDKQIKELEAKK